jgi:RNA polymerase-binding protein DksA
VDQAAYDALTGERADTLAQIAQLTEDFDGMVAASASSNADDEHDPEGATIAYERAQVVAVLDLARRRLAEIDQALARLAAGSYGSCARCGRPIGAERRAARPSATTCISCAATAG